MCNAGGTDHWYLPFGFQVMNLVKYLFFACWAGCLASWIFGFYAMI